MIRIAIIGGGISGLAAALALEEPRRAGAVEYTLYESSPNLGGVLRTERIHDCIDDSNRKWNRANCVEQFDGINCLYFKIRNNEWHLRSRGFECSRFSSDDQRIVCGNSILFYGGCKKCDRFSECSS